MYRIYAEHKEFGSLPHSVIIDDYYIENNLLYFKVFHESFYHSLSLSNLKMVLIFTDPPGYDPQPVYSWVGEG